MSFNIVIFKYICLNLCITKKKEIIDLKIYIRFYITRMILRFLTVKFIFTAKQQQQKSRKRDHFYSVRRARENERNVIHSIEHKHAISFY